MLPTLAGPTKRAPRPQVTQSCAECSAEFTGPAGRMYCKPLCRYRANYAKANRVPCTICGEPTGWKVGRVTSATHHACNRASWEHGTRRGYIDNKCRCPECRAWSKAQMREYRVLRASQGRPLPSATGSPWISAEVRAAVLARDAGACQLCGDPVDFDADPNSDWYPSLDHIIPKSQGGQHTADNLRLTHRWCNCVRGANNQHADIFNATV